MTSVDVCNQALAHIGDRQITRIDSIGQQEDPLARLCAEFYAQARKETLATFRWSFAKKAVALSERTGEPAIGRFTYTHVIPTDCIRIMQLLPAGALDADTGLPTSYVGKIDSFEIIGADVKSNELYVAAQYIYDIEDPSLWSPHFVTAVARRIAHYLSGAIGDSPNAASMHLDIYEKVDLPNAQYYDAVQDRSNENTDAETRRAGSPLFTQRFSSGYAADGIEY